MGNIINSTFTAVKTVMIYNFILELEEIKIKLRSEHFNEYIVAIRKNKKMRQWIIILMIVI